MEKIEITNRQFTPLDTEPRASSLMIQNKEVYYANILHCTYQNSYQPKGKFRGEHSHDVYHVVLVTGGRGNFVMGKSLILAEPGSLFLTSPGELHSFTNLDKETAVYCEVTFEFKSDSGRTLKIPFHELLSKWSARVQSTIPSGTRINAELYSNLMQEFEYMVRVGFSRQDYLSLRLHTSLARIFLGLILDRNQVTGSVNNPFQKIQDYIHKNFKNSLSLKELSALAGVSPNYLSRKFKDRFGMTPIYYQQKVKIQNAANLLHASDYTIKEIAEITGFSDVYFFSRIFKKVHGIPPGKYRQKARTI
jgi:AraC-like DNA-binding protein/mannose-6-phosphate isomerase-like protein (cupin superfamily)